MGQEEHTPQAVHNEDTITPYTPPIPQAHRDEDEEVSPRMPRHNFGQTTKCIQTAAYVGQEVTYVDEDTSKKLFWTINRRILACMLGTYFCQSLDKGTLGFASIMGIRKDAHLVGQDYRFVYCVHH